MGNEMCSPETKQKIGDNYNKASKYTGKKARQFGSYCGTKYANAKITYAPQIEAARIKYLETKMRAKGYTLPKVEDKSELNFLSDFERALPLVKVDLDDYERRLKKLGTKEDKDFITKP